MLPAVAAVVGQAPSGRTCTNGSDSYAEASAPCRSAVETPGASRAVEVARMPRGIGASTGVNDRVTAERLTVLRACSISGVCWCAPPAL